MKKSDKPIFTGALIGLLTLLCTYLLGTIYQGLYLTIVNLQWWVMLISTLPSLLILTFIRLKLNARNIIKLSVMSGITFISIGWIILFYKHPINRIVNNIHLSDVVHTGIGYSSSFINILFAGVFLMGILICQLAITKKHGGYRR